MIALSAVFRLRHVTPVLLVIFAVGLTGCDDDDVPESVELVRPVRALKVTDLRNFNTRYFIGTARAAQEVSLAFAVSGTVASVDVAIGDEVKTGSVVASLDPASYQAEVNRLTADLESAVATHANAREQTARQRALFEKGIVAQAAVDKYSAGEKSAQAAIKSVQAALDKAALNLSYTQLSAPFNGVVVAKYIENFEEVTAQSAVVRILGSERIEMVINIPEGYIAMVTHIENIQVTFDAIGDVDLPAEISEIGTEASATTRTFPVTLLMTQPAGARVLPGMTGRATGQPKKGYETFSGIVVPPAAVFVPEGQDQPHVWIVDTSTMTVSARPIKLAQTTSQGLSIESGLDVGNIVVTAGANSLRDGQKVSLLDPEIQ